MTRRLWALSLVLPLILFALPAKAQVEPPTVNALVLNASGDPVGASLTLEVTVAEDLDPAIQGFDIYRRVLGDCGSPVRLTDEPLPRGAVGFHQYFLDDPVATEPGVVYAYGVEVVDADRNPLSVTGFHVYVGIAYAYWGDAVVVGAGKVVGGGPPYPQLDPCADSCFHPWWIEGDAVTPYVDTGQDVLIIGQIYCSDFEGCFLRAETVVPTDCAVVPAEPRSWGALKSQY